MSATNEKSEKCELELLVEKLRQRRVAQGKRDERIAATGQLKENLGNAKEAITDAS